MLRMRRLVSIILCSASISSSVQAITVDEALVLAYNKSDEIKAAQQDFIYQIQSMPSALAGFMPRISANLQVADQKNTYDSTFRSPLTPPNNASSTTRNIRIDQPIFDGGSTINAVKAAQSSFRAQRAKFYKSEQDSLLRSIDTYLSAYAAKEKYIVTDISLAFAEKELLSAQEKFRLGDATRTEVASAEAKFAKAESDKANAFADLQAKNATYVKIFGIDPESLVVPTPPTDLPETSDIFVEYAINRNLELEDIKNTTAAYKSQSYGAKGALLPSVSLRSDVTKTYNTPEGPGNPNSRVFSTALSVHIPILDKGGAEYAAIRQANSLARRYAHAFDGALSSIKAQAIGAWEQYIALRSRIVFIDKEVAARELALEGMKHEHSVGTKTILDVLDAETKLTEAKTAAIDTHKNYLMSAYNVKAMTGQMTAQALHLPVKYFKPESEFKKAKAKIIGF